MSDICGECLEEFRLDDLGGYNPPCRCGLMCRDCCGSPLCIKRLDDDECDDGDNFDTDNPDEADPTIPGWMP